MLHFKFRFSGGEKNTFFQFQFAMSFTPLMEEVLIMLRLIHVEALFL